MIKLPKAVALESRLGSHTFCSLHFPTLNAFWVLLHTHTHTRVWETKSPEHVNLLQMLSQPRHAANSCEGIRGFDKQSFLQANCYISSSWKPLPCKWFGPRDWDVLSELVSATVFWPSTETSANNPFWPSYKWWKCFGPLIEETDLIKTIKMFPFNCPRTKSYYLSPKCACNIPVGHSLALASCVFTGISSAPPHLKKRVTVVLFQLSKAA